MLLIKSKWVFDGKQMLGQTVDDGWEQHLTDAGIKFEKVESKSEAKRKKIQDEVHNTDG